MISVLMPTYGRPELLNEAVEGFLRQTVSDCELLILNDRHDQQIVFGHPRVRIFNTATRMSVGAKRNLLNELARGALVADWDDDDIYLPTHLEHALRMLSLYRTPLFGKQRWQWKYHGAKYCRICPAGYLHTALMNRQWRQEIGGYRDQTRKSDLELLGRIQKSGVLFGPQRMYHSPTFIQRYESSRQHVSVDCTPDESDADRHLRIECETTARGVTGAVTIIPGWKSDYQKLADDSLEAAYRSGWAA